VPRRFGYGTHPHRDDRFSRRSGFPTGGAVTPTFYKNKIFAHIGVHIKCISNCSAYEKLSKNKYCIGCIA
jgi:hypothetical protein